MRTWHISLEKSVKAGMTSFLRLQNQQLSVGHAKEVPVRNLLHGMNMQLGGGISVLCLCKNSHVVFWFQFLMSLK